MIASVEQHGAECPHRTRGGIRNVLIGGGNVQFDVALNDFEDGIGKRLLVLEMIIKAALGDLCCFDNLIHGDAVDRPRCEQLFTCGQKDSAGPLTLPGATRRSIRLDTDQSRSSSAFFKWDSHFQSLSSALLHPSTTGKDS